MHFHAEIHLETNTDFEKQIEQIMAPYSEEISEDGWWDWWQIGGRWTNAHDSSYDPEADPRNQEICFLCNGTGFRNDKIGIEARKNDSTYTCNGCGRYDNEKKKLAQQ